MTTMLCWWIFRCQSWMESKLLFVSENMRGDKHFLRCFFHYFMFLKYISLLYIYIAFKYAIFYFLFLVFKNSLICQLIHCSSSIVSDSRQHKRRLSNGFSVENDFISKNGNRSPNFSMRKAAANENIGEKIIVFLSFPAYWSLFFLWEVTFRDFTLISSWTFYHNAKSM